MKKNMVWSRCLWVWIKSGWKAKDEKAKDEKSKAITNLMEERRLLLRQALEKWIAKEKDSSAEFRREAERIDKEITKIEFGNVSNVKAETRG